MKYMLIGFVALIALLVGVCYCCPKFNFRPMPKGLCAGNLPESKPNWVSSLVDTKDEHYIAPFEKMSLGAMATLLNKRFPKYVIVESNQEHLIAYKQTTLFHFTDWLCILADGNVSSSATMGYSDFGKNRSAVVRIGEAYQKFGL